MLTDSSKFTAIANLVGTSGMIIVNYHYYYLAVFCILTDTATPHHC